MFAKMTNMARTPAEVKKDMADALVGYAGKYEGPAYPYGLCLSLEDETLEKLGLDDDMPGVGDIVQFTAMAKVTSVSENEREGTDGNKTQCRRLELQITDMGIPGANESDRQVERSAERRKRFYGSPAVAETAESD